MQTPEETSHKTSSERKMIDQEVSIEEYAGRLERKPQVDGKEGSSAIGSVTDADDIYIDPVAEAKLLRKLDWNLMWIIMLLYLASFLDRSNIGNAAAAGMSTELKLKGSDLNIATSLLFVTYIIFEPPFTVLLKIVGPSKLIPTIVMAWSIITICTAFCKNFGDLAACRLLLGAAESGLFPCLTLYLGQFYYRQEQAKRTALLFTCSALSGAVNGILSYGLVHITRPLHPWQWLYVVEGTISAVIALTAIFFLPDSIEKARFLNAEEKELALLRRRKQAIWAAADQKFEWSELRKALSDPKLYYSGLTQFGMDVVLYGFGTFLVQILQGAGLSVLHSYLVTIPIYVWGSAVFITVAIISERIRKRMIFILCLAPITAIGYALLTATNLSKGVQIFACVLVATGCYTSIGLNLVWLNINQAGHYKRAMSLGVQQMIGNSAGVLAGQLYQSKWKPHYQAGQATTLGCVMLAIVGDLIHAWHLRRENRKRDNLSAEEVQRILAEGGGEAKMGDWSPTWRYQF